MLGNRCSLCKGLGMVQNIFSVMTKCPACADKIKEMENMPKNLVYELDKHIEKDDEECIKNNEKSHRKERGKLVKRKKDDEEDWENKEA